MTPHLNPHIDLSLLGKTTSVERKEIFKSFAPFSYFKKVDTINSAEGIDLFGITDFNELKEMRDRIAQSGSMKDGTKNKRGFYSTTIQWYMKMLYAIVCYGKEGITNYKAKTYWSVFIPDLYKKGLIGDSTIIKPNLDSSIEEESEDDIATGEGPDNSFLTTFEIARLINVINITGLIYDTLLIKRFIAALLTKPFVILSGLAGSGKTQLALVVAHALCKKESEQLCFVSVGADWTNREPLLGYPNALKEGEYVVPENGVLDLIIRANENPNLPFFLVLDEMNLSYVERYFADFLSAMESHKEIPLWKRSESAKDKEIPEKVALPKNLFIIGTINVDETTYMFSPKVLDRANVIEFKINEDEMDSYLSNLGPVDINKANGQCADTASDFLNWASEKEMYVGDTLKSILLEIFRQLKPVNAEFGYRVASEIYRFIKKAIDLGMEPQEAIDSAIVQKLLPKLHGSKKHIGGVLSRLWDICLVTQGSDPLRENSVVRAETCKYPISADKIVRMYKAACNNGFTSFAEA
ncbi:MAG: hypothetical protein LIP03_12050 [Bacteroidales bacterium]|nr:hypothetical protein [Bacteroidales bacterium]